MPLWPGARNLRGRTALDLSAVNWLDDFFCLRPHASAVFIAIATTDVP